MSTKHEYRVYLRLLEKIEPDASVADRIKSLRQVVEQLAPLRWPVNYPKPNGRGGFDVVFYVSDKPVYESWIPALDDSGYWCAI